jgi:FKBP-type peptidyl-prolyl cis-trans isomerase FklB
MNTKLLKILHSAGLLLVLAGSAIAQQNVAPAQTPPPAALTPEQASYLIGVTFGMQMHGVGLKQVSVDAVSRGMKDALAGKQITPAEQQQVQAYVNGVQQQVVSKNNQDADAFLAKNKTDKGVVATASGLQYKVITPGDKKAPLITATDTVTVQYRGKLLDGTEFDSSYSRGQPATFPVNGVIKGWQEALVLMRPGAKYQLFIPPSLAYGDRAQPKIPGGSLLIFDVEVLEAKNTAAAPAAPPGTPGNPSSH